MKKWMEENQDAVLVLMILSGVFITFGMMFFVCTAELKSKEHKQWSEIARLRRENELVEQRIKAQELKKKLQESR